MQEKEVIDYWSTDNVQSEILSVVKKVAEMLIDKNKKYGNSAIQPKRIFSKQDPIEQINVRIDDKLSRISNRDSEEDEDPEFDLVGYLILKKVYKNILQKEKKA